MTAGFAARVCDDGNRTSELVRQGSMDFFSGTRWGRHESYLGRTPVRNYVAHLIPYLAFRIIYCESDGFDPGALNSR
jgi:hypothetical protein